MGVTWPRCKCTCPWLAREHVKTKRHHVEQRWANWAMEGRCGGRVLEWPFNQPTIKLFRAVGEVFYNSLWIGRSPTPTSARRLRLHTADLDQSRQDDKVIKCQSKLDFWTSCESDTKTLKEYNTSTSQENPESLIRRCWVMRNLLSELTEGKLESREYLEMEPWNKFRWNFTTPGELHADSEAASAVAAWWCVDSPLLARDLETGSGLGKERSSLHERRYIWSYSWVEAMKPTNLKLKNQQNQQWKSLVEHENMIVFVLNHHPMISIHLHLTEFKQKSE